MVFLLISDVLPHLFKSRFGNGDGEVVVLPDELSFEESLLVKPVGGFPFDQHHQFGDRLIGAECDEDVEVFGPAADGIEMDAFKFAVFLDVGDELFSDVRG